MQKVGVGLMVLALGLGLTQMALAKKKKIKLTINGKPLNVLANNLSGPLTLAGSGPLTLAASGPLTFAGSSGVLNAGGGGFGNLSVTQTVPAAAAHYVPPGTSNPGPSTLGNGLTPPPATPPAGSAFQVGIAALRPDFQYNAARLAYQQRNTFTTGQITLAVGPGRPAGSKRYVPVGEF